MKIIPAIDLINGQCVRLTKGDYSKKSVYAKTPLEQAKEFEKIGADILHIVDLDAAKTGKPENLNIILEIRKNLTIPIEIGGGIRTMETAKKYLENGINRIIIGTKAVEDISFISDLIDEFGAEKIVLGIDIKGTDVAISGWEKKSGIHYKDFCKQLKKIGVTEIVVTDISKDGTLTEPNYELTDEITKMGFNAIASGGVSTKKSVDILREKNIFGAIIGKAIYEGVLDLKDVIEKKSGLTKRIIPCLDIKDGKTVSGIHFENLRDCGDPIQLAKFYADEGADELVFLDISASDEKRKTMTALVEKISEQIFIPFTVGGGISSVEDINACLQAGADKVSVSTIAATNPDFISEASDIFGSQAIVVSIDVKKVMLNNENIYKVFIHGGKTETEFEAIEFAKLMQKKGAGEILLNSLDRDGTEDGYDITILGEICNAVNIPVIASSGAGSKEDLLEAFEKTSCDAVLASSIFHFGKYSIGEVKNFLSENNVSIRK